MTIRGVAAKISATSDGRAILVMDGNSGSSMAKDSMWGGVHSYPTMSAASNSAAAAVLEVMEEHQVPIRKVRAVTSMGDIYGYVIELDADGYALLLEIDVTAKQGTVEGSL